VGASLDAIHAKGAVHIAGLLRHVELEFATALVLISSDAVVGGATLARGRALRFEGEGGKQRAGKIELPQWTNVLAKVCAAKEGVDEEGRGEVRD
jgi:hypothetical protein